MKTGLTLMFIWSFLVAGCATSAPDTGSSDQAKLDETAQLEICEQPRPQVCTMDYRPVCGSLADGGWKTFSNGCGACAVSEVSGWREGACEE